MIVFSQSKYWVTCPPIPQRLTPLAKAVGAAQVTVIKFMHEMCHSHTCRHHINGHLPDEAALASDLPKVSH